jgi:hypothetical protein
MQPALPSTFVPVPRCGRSCDGARMPTPQPKRGGYPPRNGLPFGIHAPAICVPLQLSPACSRGGPLRRRNGRREPPASSAIAGTPPKADERTSWILSHLALLPGAGSPARERWMGPSTSRRCKRRPSLAPRRRPGDKPAARSAGAAGARRRSGRRPSRGGLARPHPLAHLADHGARSYKACHRSIMRVCAEGRGRAERSAAW